jgi:NIMA-interacting peptidyl-prolyl cis-trans isomerase 1
LIKHSGSRRPASWKSEHITRSKEEAIEILKQHQKRIQLGEATLEQIASTDSDCSSAKRGGDLGYFEKGQMQPAFEQAAFGLDVGQMSDIVETDSGVHLILRTA